MYTKFLGRTRQKCWFNNFVRKMLKRLQIHNFVKNSFRTNYVSSKESKNTPFEYLLQWITQREPSIVAATCLTLLHIWPCCLSDPATCLTLLPVWPCYLSGPAACLTLLPVWPCYLSSPATCLTLLPVSPCYLSDPANNKISAKS